MFDGNHDWPEDEDHESVDQPKLERDRPLMGCWRLEDGIEVPPGLLRRGKHRDARSLILGEALVAARLNRKRWTSYSRRPAHYGRSRYRPDALTFATVTQVVDALTEEGMLENDRALPGGRGQQSRFRLTSKGWTMLARLPVAHHKTEPIVLRDADKNLAEYADTEETTRMRRDIRIFNEALRASEIELDSASVAVGEPIFDGDKCFTAHSDLHRVFNRGRFDLGGRFYGGWWQNVRSERRLEITIGGRPTAEEDYRALHPRLLYAQCEKSFIGDPYDLPEWDRKLVKRAFNIFLNAAEELSAIQALAPRIGGAGAFGKARRLLSDIKAKHKPIADQFCTGAGLRLQCVDSGIAEQVMSDIMIGRGVVCLPIHDSFIVDATKWSLLKDIMEIVLHTKMRELKGMSQVSMANSKNVPQYGDTMPRLDTLAMASADNDGSPAPARSLDLAPSLHLPEHNVNPVALAPANDNRTGPPSSLQCLRKFKPTANDNAEFETLAVESA